MANSASTGTTAANTYNLEYLRVMALRKSRGLALIQPNEALHWAQVQTWLFENRSVIEAATDEMDAQLPSLDLLIDHIQSLHATNQVSMEVCRCLLPLQQHIKDWRTNLCATFANPWN